MTIEVVDRGGVWLVKLSGSLGADEDADALIGAVTELLETRGSRLVLDLAGVPFMNSDAVGALVRVTAHANTQEGRIILASPSPFVSGVLSVTKLDKFFEIAPTVDEAVKRLAK